MIRGPIGAFSYSPMNKRISWFTWIYFNIEEVFEDYLKKSLYLLHEKTFCFCSDTF